jgi:hypothetical protein
MRIFNNWKTTIIEQKWLQKKQPKPKQTRHMRLYSRHTNSHNQSQAKHEHVRKQARNKAEIRWRGPAFA